ncbi:MAG: hypothetical protein WC545_02940 [Patescibacteria group bacterium]
MVNWEKIRNTAVWILAVLMIILIGMGCYECGRSGKIEKNLSGLKIKIIADSSRIALELYGNDSIVGLKTRVDKVEQLSANNEDSIFIVKKSVAQANKQSTEAKYVADEAKIIAATAKSQAAKANRRATALEKKQAKTEKELAAVKDSLNRLTEKQRSEALDFLKSQAAIAPPPPPAPEPEANASPVGVKNGQWGHPSNHPLKSANVADEPVADVADGGSVKKHWRYR